jgi:nucleolar protein 56
MTTNTQAFLVLHESAAGYGLYDVVAFDEIGSQLEGAANTVIERPRFMKAVKLKAFQPFDNAVEALENANAVSEHAMTTNLKSFLEMNLSGIDSKKVTLGVIDPGLATAISEGLGSKKLSLRSDETVREIARGIRMHLTHFIKGLENGAAEQAQLGLGHSYSRSKVKFNPARSDNMIIQSIALLDQMDKDLNTFAMRIREWYSWHFPELKDLVKDNYMFARTAAFVQDKNSLFGKNKTKSEDDDDDEDGNGMDVDKVEDKMPGLIEIVGDEDLALAVVAAAKSSMGMDCSPVDMVNIVNFTQRMIKMAEYRKQLAIYLSDKMGVVAPNLSTLLGDTVAARLISKVRHTRRTMCWPCGYEGCQTFSH